MFIILLNFHCFFSVKVERLSILPSAVRRKLHQHRNRIFQKALHRLQECGTHSSVYTPVIAAQRNFHYVSYSKAVSLFHHNLFNTTYGKYSAIRRINNGSKIFNMVKVFPENSSGCSFLFLAFSYKLFASAAICERDF
jgi:hypothetical protein